jgi:hypothetical protein
MFTKNLAAQSNASNASVSQNLLFRFSHLSRFSRDEFDSACGASRFATTSMKLVDTCISHGGRQSLGGLYFKRSNAFNGQLCHL